MEENRESKVSDPAIMEPDQATENQENQGNQAAEKGGRGKKRKSFLICLVLITAILAATFAGYQGYRYYQDRTNRKMQKISKVVPTEKEQDKAAPEEIDWDALQAVNPDIYAWIVVPGTDVNYPVLQSSEKEEEDYYLMHQANGDAGYPGAIYSQKRNARDFSDRMTVLYGHNMRNGSMFASLHKYEDKTFFKDHPYVFIYTPDAKYVYRIFASYNYDDRLILAYFNDFKEDDVWNNYLKSYQELYKGCLDQSAVSSLDSNDKILTLSTCNKVKTERFLVQGVLLTEDEAKAAGIENADDAQNMAAAAAKQESGTEQ